jgi:hypothetical protein
MNSPQVLSALTLKEGTYSGKVVHQSKINGVMPPLKTMEGPLPLQKMTLGKKFVLLKR